MLRIIHKALLPQERKRQRRMDYQPLDELKELQWRKLQRVLQAAYDRSPFYQDRFRAMGASPQDIRTMEDFAKIPILTRDEVLYHVSDMATMPLRKLYKDRSGGSTGHPLYYYYHHDYKYKTRVLKQRLHSWIGVDDVRPTFYVWGITMNTNVPAKIQPAHLARMASFRYGFDYLDEARLSKLAEDFLRVRPAAVFGYSNLLLSLAEYLLDRGLQVPSPPIAVVSSAETLYPENRLLMEKAFGAKVYNFYGSHENGFFGSECQERRGLHLALDHIHLEIQADGRLARPGEPGYLVVTDLDNLAMPFIRYRNEDIGAWSEEICPCGRTLPMLKEIFGREKDFVFDRDGKAYPGTNLMRFVRPSADEGRQIRQVQFLQSEKGRLRVLAVSGPLRGEEVQTSLRRDLEQGFHDKMMIDITFVEKIPVEPSGKTRFVKSTLSYDNLWKK